jgi:voltage-gated potassium channel
MDTEKTKKNLYETIFEADTRKGKLFDEVLMVLILLSILVVIFGSVNSINHKNWTLFTHFGMGYYRAFHH